MAYQATHWAWQLDLPMTEKFVLIALADMADETFSCFPGHQRLADMTGGSVDTVARALKSLDDRGAIQRTRRNSERGYRTSDRYLLLVGTILTRNLPTRQSANQADSGSLTRNVRQPNPQVAGATNNQLTTRESPELVSVEKGPRKKPKTALPAGWKPNEACMEYARTNALDLGHETSQFRASAEANDRRYSNWDQAFRTWLGNQVAWRKPSQPALVNTDAWMNAS